MVEIQALSCLKESVRIRTALLLATYCGLRIGECRGLQFEDYDEKNRILNICHNVVDHETEIKVPKNNSIRLVCVPEIVGAAIAECHAHAFGSTFVLFNENSTDTPMLYQSIRRGFFRAMQKIGISEMECKRRKLTFHSLRHTFVTLAKKSGLSTDTIKSLSDHKNTEMIDLYSGHQELIDFEATRKSIEVTAASQ